MINIKLFVTTPDGEPDLAFIPTRATDGSAGYDVRANIKQAFNLYPGDRTLIPLGFALDFSDDPNKAVLLLPRSGHGSKGITLSNSPGLGDSDYQGQYKASVFNTNRDGRPFTIRPGDRIAQLVLVPVLHEDFALQEEFAGHTERGEGGFGSTDNPADEVEEPTE